MKEAYCKGDKVTMQNYRATRRGPATTKEVIQFKVCFFSVDIAGQFFFTTANTLKVSSVSNIRSNSDVFANPGVK